MHLPKAFDGEDPRRQPDIKHPRKPIFIKNGVAASTSVLVKMGNGFSRGESPDLGLMPRVFKTPIFKRTLKIIGNSSTMGDPEPQLDVSWVGPSTVLVIIVKEHIEASAGLG